MVESIKGHGCLPAKAMATINSELLLLLLLLRKVKLFPSDIYHDIKYIYC